MKILQTLPLLALIGLPACYARVVAEPAGPPPPAEAEVTVATPPPAEQVEVIPASPGPQWFWVRGHWQWNGVRYVWRAGHYERHRAGLHWQAAHYENRGGSWVYIPGRWVR